MAGVSCRPPSLNAAQRHLSTPPLPKLHRCDTTLLLSRSCPGTPNPDKNIQKLRGNYFFPPHFSLHQRIFNIDFSFLFPFFFFDFSGDSSINFN